MEKEMDVLERENRYLRKKEIRREQEQSMLVKQNNEL